MQKEQMCRAGLRLPLWDTKLARFRQEGSRCRAFRHMLLRKQLLLAPTSQCWVVWEDIQEILWDTRWLSDSF
ncbi:hypothetical protein MHYP_G00300720 [Metynnis hypsauchen]